MRNLITMTRLTTLVTCFCLIGSTQHAFGQCDWEETHKLLASDGSSNDYFGLSVSIDGDTMVTGASSDDDNGTDSGSAYVFRYEPVESVWIQEAKLLASDGSKYDSFGTSVSIDGDAIVVGAFWDNDNGFDSGSAYVFRYDPDGSGQWIEEDKLLASDGYTYDDFGYSVSIDGDAIVVGAHGDDANGSAYVFRYDPDGSGQWIQEAKLLASDGDSGDNFGYSVSIDGDAIVVGAHGGDDDNGTYYTGSAYVFRYDPDGSGQWIEEDKLLASDGAEYDRFGTSVSIDGDAIVVGARDDEDNGSKSGSAYVFRYDGVNWLEEAKLLASDGSSDDYFGESLSIDGDAIIVGAHLDDDNGTDSGSAYVFRYDPDGSGQWIEEAKLLASDGNSEDVFGTSVSIDGDAIAVGARLDDDNGTYYSGSAYVFDLTACIPTLTVSPDPLIAGQNGTFTADYVNPNTQTYLAYSLGGVGSTYIPQLNITLDLSQPAQAGNTITSDNDGIAEWVLFVPNAGAGWNVWFQACQYELTTNVVATSIE